MKTLKLSLMPLALFSLMFLSGCENSEFADCKTQASKLWDAKQDDPKKNKAYWNAIQDCKDKYDN